MIYKERFGITNGKEEKGQFHGRNRIVLAAAGSAVGLVICGDFRILRHNMAEEYLFLYTLYLHLHLALLL